MIMVIGFGIAIFTQLIDKAEEFNTQVSERNKQRVKQLLSTNDPVTIPENVRTISRGDNPIFHLGIKNELNTETTFNYKLMKGNTPPDSSMQSTPNILTTPKEVTIPAGESTVEKFMIRTTQDTKSGSHIYYMNVTTNGETYYQPITVQINVR